MHYAVICFGYQNFTSGVSSGLSREIKERLVAKVRIQPKLQLIASFRNSANAPRKSDYTPTPSLFWAYRARRFSGRTVTPVVMICDVT